MSWVCLIRETHKMCRARGPPGQVWEALVYGNVLGKIGKVPNTCRYQYQRFVRERQLQITRLFSKLPFWKSFLALCKANDAKATIVSVCIHWCCLHEWSWIGMWWLKVAYESNESRSLQFVELIITSGTLHHETSYVVIFIVPVCVIHKREFIMHSTISWLTLKPSTFSVKITVGWPFLIAQNIRDSAVFLIPLPLNFWPLPPSPTTCVSLPRFSCPLL